jgi:hypothetical protein
MLKNIPGLLPIWFIFFKFLILWFNICLCTFSSVFHTFCNLSSLSISTCSWIRLCILLLCCVIILTFFSSCVCIRLCWSSTWLCWLLTRSMNILYLTWVRLLLLLLHFGFVFINLYLNNWKFIDQFIGNFQNRVSFNFFNFQI